MSDLTNPDSFTDALQAVEHIIEFFENRGMIIGGVAVSLLAKPRYTADIDAMLLFDIEDIDRLLEQAVQQGLKPRISNPIEFARQTRVLLLYHEASKVNVDISLGVLPFEEEAVQRSQLHQMDRFTLRLPSPEDLIILKAIAHRPKDLIDIQSLIDTYTDLDEQRIERCVREFAEALEMPELWDEVAVLFSPKHPRQK